MTLEQKVEQLEKRVAELEKNQPSRKCICCKSRIGTLVVDEGKFICTTCAQVMNELGNEMEYDAKSYSIDK